MKNYIIGIMCMLACVAARGELTLEQCQDKAQENYPVLRKYDIVNRITDVSLSDINKGWLPSATLYGQGTIQNVVPAFPDMLNNMMQTMGGTPLKGLSKFQWKVGADVSQTIWDGGASKARRSVERASGEVSSASLDVEMYDLRQRVENIYFAILLTERQIEESTQSANLLAANLERIRAMEAGGVATPADGDMVEAQLLSVNSLISQARTASEGYRKVLSIYIGQEVGGQKLVTPGSRRPQLINGDKSQRPEMLLFDARNRLNNARLALTDVSLMPKIGAFAQMYYGYAGIDYFKAMMNRNPSFNIVGGVRLSWELNSLYTKKNNRSKIALSQEDVEADRELFLYNMSLREASQNSNIDAIENLMKDDDRIIELRTNVRKAAESQLTHGIIDATALLTKITDENQARLQSAYHQIQLIQSIYQLKHTLNEK